MVIDSYESKCVFGMKLITERNEWKALSGCLNSISWKKIHDGRFFLLATRGICKFNLWFRYAIDALIGNCRVKMEFGIELISYCGD